MADKQQLLKDRIDAPAWVADIVNRIDDATNRTYARLYEAEDTRAAFDVFGRYYDQYGLPQALYSDRDSIYQVNATAVASAAPPPLTQFGRAMKQLNVRIILAYSPQARGHPAWKEERSRGIQ